MLRMAPQDEVRRIKLDVVRSDRFHGIDPLDRQAILQSKRDAEEAERERKLNEERRIAEARAKKEQEFKVVEENLAHLGFALERFTRLSSTNRQQQSSATSMEDCALQCLQTSWCVGFTYRASKVKRLK
jgi:hypothetical protein